MCAAPFPSPLPRRAGERGQKGVGDLFSQGSRPGLHSAAPDGAGVTYTTNRWDRSSAVRIRDGKEMCRRNGLKQNRFRDRHPRSLWRRVPAVGTLRLFRCGIFAYSSQRNYSTSKAAESQRRRLCATCFSGVAFLRIHHKGIIQHQRPQSRKGSDSALFAFNHPHAALLAST